MFFLTSVNENSGYSSDLSSGTTFQLLYSIFVLILMLVCIYFAGKFLRNKNIGFVKSENLEIVDKLSLGIGNSLAILRCGESYSLISITKEKVTYLTELTKEELILVEKESLVENKNMSFTTVFNDFLKSKSQVKGENNEEDM
ncbi:MAG: FliO/MopB family protein [Lachnospirales bacterium]